MKFASVLALGTLSLAASPQAPLIPQEPPSPPSSLEWAESQANAEKFLIELAPGETRWVTEREKWDLKLVSRFLQ